MFCAELMIENNRLKEGPGGKFVGNADGCADATCIAVGAADGAGVGAADGDTLG